MCATVQCREQAKSIKCFSAGFSFSCTRVTWPLYGEITATSLSKTPASSSPLQTRTAEQQNSSSSSSSSSSVTDKHVSGTEIAGGRGKGASLFLGLRTSLLC